MSASVIQFPEPKRDQPWSDEQWREFMIDLHARLFEALERENVEYNLTLSLDDICELMQAIETTVGPEHFDHDTE
jgi:hypothetical protein